MRLNVPFDLEGKVSDSTKIERHKITIDELIHKGAKIIIMSHLGRPNGKYKDSLSLSKYWEYLQRKLKYPKLQLCLFVSQIY